MNIFKIVYNSIKQRGLASALTVFSIMLGVSLVVAIIILRQESEEAFNQTATGYELIVGPKGSPLQLTLNTVYHIGVPIQNMPLSVYELLKNDKRVKVAIPYVLGDNFQNFRLVGTVPEIFSEFEYKKGINYKFKEGNSFSNEQGAVLGYEAAQRTGLKLDDSFTGSHGVDSYEGSEEHDELRFKVTGILEKTFTPSDKVIFIPMSSVWKIHDHSDTLNDSLVDQEKNKTITSVLLTLKNPVYFDLLRRQINDNKFEGINAQAVMPVFEIRQLFDIVGNINSILLVIAYLVIFVAAISILVSLYNSMNERRRDIAIMRSLGASRSVILKIIILEGALISLAGGILGILFGHLVIYIMKNNITELTGIQITGLSYNVVELYLLAGTFVLGIIVSVIPALKAYSTDVARNLAPIN